jgi:hypothetical protein
VTAGVGKSCGRAVATDADRCGVSGSSGDALAVGAGETVVGLGERGLGGPWGGEAPDAGRQGIGAIVGGVGRNRGGAVAAGVREMGMGDGALAGRGGVGL